MIRKLIRYFKNKPGKESIYESKILNELIPRSHYAYCCLNAARQASKLGLKRIAVIEFGCAGGAGLIDLEKISSEISQLTNVEFEIYGFDSGKGLPEPQSYKDLPYQWRRGFFKMNRFALENRLTKAKVIYGDVKDTVINFFKDYKPAVIGCVFHDLDFYSSTKASFEIFKNNENFFLPRSFHYFDDIIGDEIVLYSKWTGERLAIKEFNEELKNKKFDKCYHLTTKSETKIWYHQIRSLHLFNHDKYCNFISTENQQIPL